MNELDPQYLLHDRRKVYEVCILQCMRVGSAISFFFIISPTHLFSSDFRLSYKRRATYSLLNKLCVWCMCICSILRCMVSQFLDMLVSIEKNHTKTLIISSRKKILLRLTVNDSGSHLWRNPLTVSFSFQIFDLSLCLLFKSETFLTNKKNYA